MRHTLFAIVAALAASTASAQTCPDSCTTSPPECPVICLFTTDAGIPDQCSNEVRGHHVGQRSCLNMSIGGWINFDRELGFVDGGAGARSECGSVAVDVLCADRFRLVGPASSTPLAFTARLDFSREPTCSVTAALREGNGPAPFEFGTTACDYYAPCQGTVSLTLSHLPGEEFDLRYGIRIGVSGGKSGYGQGQLAFGGVPAGYAVVSCSGYSRPLPVTTESWSRIKQLYDR